MLDAPIRPRSERLVCIDPNRFTQRSDEGLFVLDDLDWFRRLADVPGVAYEKPPGLSPETLPGYGATPDLQRYEGGASLWWEDGSEITSQSPASAHAMFDGTRANAERIVQRLQEVLELPGTASDYHFALLSAVDSLYGLRFSEPGALNAVERFCLLDIQLIEAKPAAFLYATPEGTERYYSFPTLSRLITLYSTEGYLREAMMVVEKAEHFDQAQQHRERIRARIAAIEAEGEL